MQLRLLLVLAAGVGGCVADPGMPLEADRQLIARVEAAAIAMRDTPAREAFNHYADNPRARRWRDAIMARQQMTAEDLDEARQYLQRRLDLAALMDDWSPPADVLATGVTEPLTIEGALDEAVWRRAAAIDVPYPVNQLTPQRPAIATARVLWDQTHLYFAFDVRDAALVAPRLPHDGKTYLYDCVEVFLLTDRDAGTFWELNVSPHGDIYDAHCVYLPDAWGSRKAPERNIADLKVGCRVRSDGYTVEIAIPRDALRRDDNSLTDQAYILLGVSDVVREDGRKRHTYYSHTPAIATFHNIACYSPLRLKEQ